MLPFLKPKKMSAVIIAKTKPEGGVEPMHEEGEQMPEMVGIAEALISAIHSKDANAVAEALHAAMDCYEPEMIEEAE